MLVCLTFSLLAAVEADMRSVSTVLVGVLEVSFSRRSIYQQMQLLPSVVAAQRHRLWH